MKKNLFFKSTITIIFLVSSLYAKKDILNVSYDIARELYASINPVFIEEYAKKNGEQVKVRQSHAGTSKQARAILQGLQADVVTFNQFKDIQILHTKGNFVHKDWQKRLPNGASPYYSLPAFLVRKGNPKNIKSWSDLVREDIDIVFPNPKTSGNARYTYLAAYAYGVEKYGEKGVDDFVSKIFARVKVFDTGGRGATTTFVERKIGDVLITFEAEVMNIINKEGGDKYERVVPKISLKADFPIAVVDKIVDKKGTRDIAQAYVEFLYSQKGQEIIATFNNRVHHPKVQKRFAKNFPDVQLLNVDEVFGGWNEVAKVHFKRGAKLDKIFNNRRKFR